MGSHRIGHDWCDLAAAAAGDGSGKEHSCQCKRYKKTQVWSLGEDHPLQEGTAAYSNILAWRILWTEEPVGLQSVELWRGGHNWSDLEYMHAPIFNLLFTVGWANIFPYKELYSNDFNLSLNLLTKKLSVHPRCRIQCCLWWQNGMSEKHKVLGIKF